MPLITISENMSSGGMEIAKMVAEGLKLELYDDRRLQAEALKLGVRSELLRSLDEKTPGLFDRILGKKPGLYLDIMEAVVYEVSRRGQGVIIGHGSQILLADFGCALHVRIHASRPQRIRNLMDAQNLSPTVAEELIRKSDNERSGYFKFVFQRDLNDPSLYDLIFNTEKVGNEAASKFIIELARSDEISTCSLTALDAMEKMSQTKKVEAELLENNINLALLHIDVPQKGMVRVHGLAYTPEEKDRIQRVIEAMPEFGKSSIDVKVTSGF